jgi:hypothetical protein
VIYQRPFTPCCGSPGVLHRDGRFSHPCGTENQRAGAALDTSCEQGIKRWQITGELFVREIFPVLSGDEAGVHDNAPLIERVIVIAFTIRCGSHLDYLKMTARHSIRALYSGKPNDTMHNAQDLLILVARGIVVEQQYRCIADSKELLQRQELSPVPKGILSQQPELRKRLDHQSLWRDTLNLCLKLFDRGGQLHLSRVKTGVAILFTQVGFVRHKFSDRYIVE